MFPSMPALAVVSVMDNWSLLFELQPGCSRVQQKNLVKWVLSERAGLGGGGATSWKWQDLCGNVGRLLQNILHFFKEPEFKVSLQNWVLCWGWVWDHSLTNTGRPTNYKLRASTSCKNTSTGKKAAPKISDNPPLLSMTNRPSLEKIGLQCWNLQ